MRANVECSSFVGYFIDVRNLHDCHMKFDYVHISLTHEKILVWNRWRIGTNYSRDVRIGTNSSPEIYEV